MFEVVINNLDGTIEIWDGISEMQAECVFFRARMKSSTAMVQINEAME
jgi:hypothetical protein|tara:strand:+ start:1098 stop:1241 length:144 start_codon:yes stop_codon:yes gene_type:complete